MNGFLQLLIKKYFLLFLFAYCLLPIFSFSQGTWVQKANFGGGARHGAFCFSIGINGYIGTGLSTYNGSVINDDFWEWNRTTNVWTQKANYGGGKVQGAIGFAIGSKGYAGTGTFNDFWEYEPGTNIWTKKANFSGQGRNQSIGFSIGTKGYIGTGLSNGFDVNDFWEWDQTTNVWTQKATLPGSKRQDAVGFSIANKGYIGTGMDSAGNFLKDFWEYDQATDTWSQKADFPGGKRWLGYGFSIGNYGYVGMGLDSTYQTPNDLWRYFPFTNTWIQVTSFPGGSRFAPVGFSIGCQGFFGTGNDTSGTVHADFWEYFPDTITASISGNVTLCAGDSASLYAFGGIHYSWSTGATTQFITINPDITTTYSVAVSDTCGIAATVATITVQNPVATFTYPYDACTSGSVQFINNSTSASSWYWSFGDKETSILHNPLHVYSSQGSYSVTLLATSSFGCTSIKDTLVNVPPFSEIYIPNAFSPNGDNNNDIYYISGSCITQMTFIIYDRWGEKVFEYSGADMNSAQGWDGRYKGQMENAGVFMYSFNGTLTTGEKVNQKGNITLMR